MIKFRRLTILLLSLFLYNCSANLYYVNSTLAEQTFRISEDKKIAIPTFISTDSQINTLTTNKFVSGIDSSLASYIMKPIQVDSILINNGIYSLPNKIPHALIVKIDELLDAEYLLIGYVLKWDSADLGQDGIVKHRIGVYNLKSKELIWSITNEVFISAPESDESIYFISSVEYAYEKLASKTLKEISLKSNIKKKGK